MTVMSTVNHPPAGRCSDQRCRPVFRRRRRGPISPWLAIMIALLLYALTAIFVVSQDSYVPSLVKLWQSVKP